MQGSSRASLQPMSIPTIRLNRMLADASPPPSLPNVPDSNIPIPTAIPSARSISGAAHMKDHRYHVHNHERAFPTLVLSILVGILAFIAGSVLVRLAEGSEVRLNPLLKSALCGLLIGIVFIDLLPEIAVDMLESHTNAHAQGCMQLHMTIH